MRLSHDMLLKYPEEGRVAVWKRVWRAVRGIYRGECAETRARRWWSREDRRRARETLRLTEARAAVDAAADEMLREMYPRWGG